MPRPIFGGIFAILEGCSRLPHREQSLRRDARTNGTRPMLALDFYRPAYTVATFDFIRSPSNGEYKRSLPSFFSFFYPLLPTYSSRASRLSELCRRYFLNVPSHFRNASSENSTRLMAFIHFFFFFAYSHIHGYILGNKFLFNSVKVAPICYIFLHIYIYIYSSV
jgi:hypothetical protein